MKDCKSNQNRSLVMEGSNIKFKDHSLSSFTSSKIDVHVILFTDLLLICKKVSTSHAGKKSKDLTTSTTPSTDKVKVIRPPYLIDRLIPVTDATSSLSATQSTSGSASVSHAHSLTHGHSFGGHSKSEKELSSFSLIYLNEFKTVSSLLSFSAIDAKVWLEQIKRAQVKYAEAKRRAFLSISSQVLQSPSLYQSINISSTTEYAERIIDPLYSNQFPDDACASEDKSYYGSCDESTQIVPSGNNNNNYYKNYYRTPSSDHVKPSPSCTSLAQANAAIAQLQQQNQLLLQSHRSSRSSLFLSHSHSGSIELSDFLSSAHAHSSPSSSAHAQQQQQHSQQFPAPPGQYYGSTLSVIPAPTHAPSSTPNPWLLSADPSAIAQAGLSRADLTTLPPDACATSQPSRARSFELGDLRNPSLTVDESFCRSHSMETRGSPVHVLVTSPRPERRAFLLKGSGSPHSSCDKYESSNSLNVPGGSGVSNVSSRKSSVGSGANSGRVTAVPMAGHGQAQGSDPTSKPVMRSIQTQTIPPRNVQVISKSAATNTVTVGHGHPSPPFPHQPASQTMSMPPKVLPRSASVVGQGIVRKTTPPKVPPRKGIVPPPVPRPVSSPNPVPRAPSPSMMKRSLSPINKPPLIKTKNVAIVPQLPPRSESVSDPGPSCPHHRGHSCGSGQCPSDQGVSILFWDNNGAGSKVNISWHGQRVTWHRHSILVTGSVKRQQTLLFCCCHVTGAITIQIREKGKMF